MIAGILAAAITVIPPAPPVAANDATPSDAGAPSRALAPSRDDAWWLAATIWAEARGQGERGMRAVADVIANRARASGRTVRAIVTARGQFGVWARGRVRPSHKRLGRLDPDGMDGRAWAMAQHIAREVLDGGRDTTAGATSFCQRRCAGRRGITRRIGAHVFYKRGWAA